MTRKDYLDRLFETYRLVKVLADKNGCRTLQVRHKTLSKDLIVHELSAPCDAYNKLCDLRCEHLPEVFDVIDTEDGQVVLEEYIDGMTVSEIMQAGRYRYRGVKRVLAGVCDALTVLHERGLVHRDVKPENVMVTKNGRVVLIDFNASRTVKETKKDTVVMGTVGYASPEQLGITQSDARTDIYAVGILLNVMLTGKHPSEQTVNGKAAAIVKKCTQLSPADRYQTAAELKEAL